jgi:hypothetical protein
VLIRRGGGPCDGERGDVEKQGARHARYGVFLLRVKVETMDVQYLFGKVGLDQGKWASVREGASWATV